MFCIESINISENYYTAFLQYRIGEFLPEKRIFMLPCDR